MKGQHYGELEAAKFTKPYITIEQYGQSGWVHVHKPPKEDVRLAQGRLRRAREAMLSEEYDIIVLDEITTTHYFELVPLEDMLELIRSRPDNVELAFAGSTLPKSY